MSNKRSILSSLLLGAAIASLFLLPSCGSSSSSDEETLTSYTVGGSFSINSSQQNLRTNLSNDDPEDLMLVFQNQHTRRAYFSDIDESGSFSLDVEISDGSNIGDTFMVGVMRKDPFEYIATIVESEDTGVTGFTVGSEIGDLVINYDSSKNLGVLTANATSLVFDDDLSARIISGNGKLAGIGNHGKGADSERGSNALSAGNKLDPDRDGIPNIIDSMDNGVDLDNTRESTRESAVAGSDIAEHASMFMNYKVEFVSRNSSTVTDDAMITIEVVVDDASEVDSIVADLVHTNYQDATFDKMATGFTEVDTYPSENTLWSDEGYALYHAQNFDGDDIWTVFIKPNNNTFDVGDFIRLKATLTDSSVEYYLVGINFKFQSTLYDDTNWDLSTGNGTVSDPFCILPTGGRVFYWDPPEDEDGNELEDLDYSFELFHLAGDTPETVVHNGVIEIDIEDDETFQDDLSEAEIDAYEGNDPAVEVLQVDIKASYPYGDNTALKFYMARPSWNENCD